MKRINCYYWIVAGVLFSCQQQPPQQVSVDPYQNAITMCFVPAGMKWDFSEEKAPLIEGMDILDFPVSTKDPLARKYFNQGLLLAYAFNHAEAERSFQYAASLDPDFAMAYWGQAYVLGPNYNAGMEPEHYSLAYAAIQKAKGLMGHANEKEVALIKALEKRYVEEPLEERGHLDLAYSEAMADVWQEFPNDPDVGTLYVESLMDLQPWDLWEKNGKAKGNTDLIVSTLEKVIEIHPDHPGGHHLYIHAVEGSKSPEKGLNSARLFDDGLSPMTGHLVHMPSHIYIQTGHYHEGTLANLRAAKVDSLYIETCEAQGLYPLAYFPHNFHFMAGTSILEGNQKWAVFAADRLYEHIDKEMMDIEGLEMIQHYSTIPYFVRVKFGLWDEILEMDLYDGTYPYQNGVLHYARGMAYLGKNDISSAQKELQSLSEFAADKSLEKATIFGINSLKSILEIAEMVLEGEIFASKNQLEEAVAKLKEAAELEDDLLFNEPPDWFLSVRHHLGAVLIEAGKFKDAIDVYERDLEVFPNNGWALSGIKKALELEGNKNAAVNMGNKFKEAWQTSDIQISGSRIK